MTFRFWLSGFIAFACGVVAAAPAIHEGYRRYRLRARTPTGSVLPFEEGLAQEVESRLEAVSDEDVNDSDTDAQSQPRGLLSIRRRLLNFDLTFPVKLVVPTFRLAEEMKKYVAAEDLAALEAIAKVIVVPASQMELVKVVHADDVEVPSTDNLVVICNTKRNCVLREIMRASPVRDVFDFVPIVSSAGEAGEDRLALRYMDRTYLSPYYDQERRVRLDPTGYSGPFVDYAVMAKFSSPWNPRAKIFVVAGIRALGTLGAGRFIENNLQLLDEKVGCSDFACIIRVERGELKPGVVEVGTELLDVTSELVDWRRLRAA